MRHGAIVSLCLLLCSVVPGCDPGTQQSTDDGYYADGTGAGGEAGAPSGKTPEVSVSLDDCTDTSYSQVKLTQQYDTTSQLVTGGGKSYQVATNWWHLFDGQSVSVDALGFTVNDPNEVASSQTDGAPIGYPTLYIGTYAGAVTLGSNLPKKVTDIESVHTVFDTDALEHDTSNINAAYDVWLTATNEPLATDQYDPGEGGAFLMVWLFDPEDRQPRGSNAFPAHTVEGLDGTWDVWIHNTDPVCISYVRTEPVGALAFDLNHFIQDSIVNGYGVTDTMSLSVVFAGFEIWGKGDGLTMNHFCADVK